MSECPFDTKLGDISEALCRSIRTTHPGLEFDTGIFQDWAREHEPELHAKEQAFIKRLGEFLQAKEDFDAFRKAAVAWGKAVIEIYKRYEAAQKAREPVIASETKQSHPVNDRSPRQPEQARLI